MDFKHVSVLLDETVSNLNTRPNGIYVDGTLGGAGHSLYLLSNNPQVRLVGIDQDADALNASTMRLKKYTDRVTLVHNNFSNVKQILDEIGIEYIDGAILDLGVSSYQLDNAARGFSYIHNAPLDMRMNRENDLNAYKIVNDYSLEQLTQIFYDYGEEKWSRRIAEFIVDKRGNNPIETTFELSDIIKAAIPVAARVTGGHPAKRIFQAIRIEVNGELRILEQAIRDFCDVLSPNGRLCVITFHSLEDRIVKQTFADLAKGCVCPKELPVCVCGRKPRTRIITRKPILPSSDELEKNPRSKSAKLRVLEKI